MTKKELNRKINAYELALEYGEYNHMDEPQIERELADLKKERAL